MDVHSPEQRRFNMSRIRGKDTRPEMIVRRWLWANGYRYRIHQKDLPGKPDIILPRYRVVKWPKTNREFWRKKIKENAMRDQHHHDALLESGWNCYVVWECQLKGENPKVFSQLKCYLENESGN